MHATWRKKNCDNVSLSLNTCVCYMAFLKTGQSQVRLQIDNLTDITTTLNADCHDGHLVIALVRDVCRLSVGKVIHIVLTALAEPLNVYVYFLFVFFNEVTDTVNESFTALQVYFPFF